VVKIAERFEKAGELLVKEEFLEELEKAENDVDVRTLFSDYGVELSEEDIELMVQQSADLYARCGEELSSDDLDNVAGGGAAAIGAFVMGTAALIGIYKYYVIRRKKRFR